MLIMKRKNGDMKSSMRIKIPIKENKPVEFQPVFFLIYDLV